jgi:hypothetical protein
MRKPNWVVNDCRETDADGPRPTSNVVVETRAISLIESFDLVFLPGACKSGSVAGDG